MNGQHFSVEFMAIMSNFDTVDGVDSNGKNGNTDHHQAMLLDNIF
jgi:hypothetical protein